MEDLFVSENNFRPVENSTPIPRNMDMQDSKPSHLIKPLPDETAPRYAEYLGSYPVTEATPEERAAYVGKQLELIAKRNSSCLKPVCIAMTLSGVKICDPTMKEVYMSHALRRISYTTCVPNEHLLSFVSRNPGEPLTNQYCHSFRTEHAAEINSIIGGAFLTAYTLKRRKKKKRLSLEMTDDFENATSAENDGLDSVSTTTSNDDDVIIVPKRHPRKSSSSAAGESSEEYSPEKKNVLRSNDEKKNCLSELESRVFAALNEKAQSTDKITNGVTRRWPKHGAPGPNDPGLERVSSRSRLLRRPLSYHEMFSRPRNNTSAVSLHQAMYSDALPEDSTVDFSIENLRISESTEVHARKDFVDEPENPNRRKKCLSLDPATRNMRPSDAYNRARDQERRMRENLEAQINADTLRSNAGAGGCAPTKSLSDFFPFKLGKKKKEKKKYTRSKTESVLVADRTFDRMWNPRQRLNTCDNIAFRQRTELVPTSSMVGLVQSPPESPTGVSENELPKYTARRTNSYESEVTGSGSPTSTINDMQGRFALPRPSASHSHILAPRQRSSLASGTTSTATTSSSCPSSTYLTDATCEDSGMYTQSSNASSSSSDSCGRKSSCRSSGTDSVMSSRSAVWYPQSTVNLDSSLASLESKTNAERLRQSLAAQMISNDNFVSLDAKLMSAAWYHPGIPIDVAMGILKGEEDGSFLLVRPIRKGASYTLVVSCRGVCKLYNINKIDKVGYHIEGKNQFFPHVYIMIAQYSCHPGPLPFKLKTMQLFNPLCKERLDQ